MKRIMNKRSPFLMSQLIAGHIINSMEIAIENQYRRTSQFEKELIQWENRIFDDEAKVDEINSKLEKEQKNLSEKAQLLEKYENELNEAEKTLEMLEHFLENTPKQNKDSQWQQLNDDALKLYENTAKLVNYINDLINNEHTQELELMLKDLNILEKQIIERTKLLESTK